MIKKIFTVEYDPDGEKVELHLNEKGIDELVDLLNRIKEKGINDQEHLMTMDWGGDGLTNEKQNQKKSVKLINHLKLFYWK